jgi:Glycosyltransferase
MRRLLVAFPQWAHDPASGAARSTRLIGEWLAAAGWDVRCVTAAFSESRRWLTSADVGAWRGERLAEEPGGWVKFQARGVAHRLLTSARSGQAKLDAGAAAELARGVRRALEAFRPEVFLTYGDDAWWRELRVMAARRGAKVVYAVHNAAHVPTVFAGVTAVLAPTEWLAEHYARQGVAGVTAILPPVDPGETVAEDGERVFTTLVNPSPEKGRAVFIGIAQALAARGAEVPLLVIEGRGGSGELVVAAERVGVDLRAMRNVMVAPAVAEPREFLRVTRTLIVPSLHEAAGRVVAEAQLNGIPCVVSDRGGLPEMCGGGGRVIALPAEVTLETERVSEVSEWVNEIERLAADEAYYATAAAAARRSGERFAREALLPRYAAWFAGLG